MCSKRMGWVHGCLVLFFFGAWKNIDVKSLISIGKALSMSKLVIWIDSSREASYYSGLWSCRCRGAV